MTFPDNRQHLLLDAMGIDVWVSRQQPHEQDLATPASSPIASAQSVSEAAESVGLSGLSARVANCTACELHRSRTQTVFGTGDVQATCMVIGEAPGAEEDRRGEPFVGRAGQLLNSMLAAIGFKREQVYIANILKCRPPNNRDPEPAEVASCSDYLAHQIALIQPRVILAVGRIAAQNLLATETPIGRMRGQIYQYPGTDIPVVVTYHPAYLLRSPGEKRKAWQDLQVAAGLLSETLN